MKVTNLGKCVGGADWWLFTREATLCKGLIFGAIIYFPYQAVEQGSTKLLMVIGPAKTINRVDPGCHGIQTSLASLSLQHINDSDKITIVYEYEVVRTLSAKALKIILSYSNNRHL